MPTTLYSQRPSLDEEDPTSYIFDPSLSPTAALFPPELSAPYAESPLNLPLGEFNTASGHQARLSLSSYSDAPSTCASASTSHQNANTAYSTSNLSFPHFSTAGSTGSRPPSLSPSSQAQSLRPLSALSPSQGSSASPSSNFSSSITDDFLLPNSFNTFTASELDMLFLQDPDDSMQLPHPIEQGQSQYQHAKPGQSLPIPSHRSSSGHSADLTSADFLQNIFNTGPLSAGNGAGYNSQSQVLPKDDPFDMLNLVNASPVPPPAARRDVPQMQPYSFPNFAQNVQNTDEQPLRSQANQQPQLQQQQHTIPPQWMSQQMPIDQKKDTWPIDMFNDFGNKLGPAPFNRNQVQGDPFTVGQTSFDSMGAQFAQRPPSPVKGRQAASLPQSLPARKISAQKGSDGDSETVAVPIVGKHNKTERKYRQKVQAAQADLRDSIPALRVLYGTSNEDQKRTTDFRAADGTVDGLGEVTRPNASAKATILIAARVYIELLQKRSAMLQRKVDELEQFRSAVAGEEDLISWREQFEAKEREIKAAEDAKIRNDDESSDEDEEEEEEDEPKRKRPRTVAPPKAAPKGKPGPKGKKNNGKNEEDPSAGAAAGGSGLRVFAAFAMSFSLVPSASNLFKHAPVTEVGSTDQLFSGSSSASASIGQVLARLPLITAEHTSRLLARGLPNAMVPSGHTLVDWTWRLLVAVLLAVSMGPIIARLTRDNQGKEMEVGSLRSMIDDGVGLIARRNGKEGKGEKDDQAQWDRAAAGIFGNTVTSTSLVKWHIILHLNATASSAYSLALLALLQPEVPLLRSPETIWHDAHSKLDATSPPALAAVLQLPLHEALRILDILPPTSAPIAAIAEQITLVHIYDLYTRFFIRLVDASTTSAVSTNSDSTTLVTLLANLESHALGNHLRSSAFDKEIRGVIETVPKGSVAHALGLVLIGLWGIFSGPKPSAQAALAVALAMEETRLGTTLSAVSSMLKLLYPGFGSSKMLPRNTIAVVLPPNAGAVDKLALACIEYIRLLTSSAALNDSSLTRLQRLEASKEVQRATSRLRLVLTQTDFVGMDEEYTISVEDDHVEDAEEGEDGTREEAAQDEVDGESKKFDKAKERLVGVLCEVGRRAAGRAGGRDEDSGLEGDLDEL